MARILQIVPKRPRGPEAVSQVAQLLGAGFASRGHSTVTLYGSDGLSHLAEQLENGPGDTSVLLHYVGYGYARRGAPLSLASTLARWRRASRGGRLLVHFHEVAAFGPPWRSSFWMRPLQLRAARILARSSDGTVTSLERYAALLLQLSPRPEPRVLAIFSAIGEPREITTCERREPSLVLFGSPQARRQVWDRLHADVAQAVAALGVERVVEIGSPAGGPSRVSGAVVKSAGELDSGEVSELLGESRAGFLCYPATHLSKSTAFAAMAAHGVLPICGWPAPDGQRGEGEGSRWVHAGVLAGLDEAQRSSIAASAADWYRGHSLQRHVETWLGWIS